MQCGLLGRKLGHSYSPQIHSLLADYDYRLYEVEPDALGDFLRNADFSGLNVTMPYKKDVIPYLDALTPVARRLGAVNTIVRNADGTLTGHNSDFFGFSTMLRHSGLDVAGKKVLVLGSGGASNTAVAVLQDNGANVITISRSGEHNYKNLHLHQDAAVIVNTTPVGMYPNTGLSPVALSLFPNLEGVLDVVYNPAKTQLLLDAQKRGLITENGLLMLIAQAKESAEWFSGCAIPDARITEIHKILRNQMENIVLIGMPGSGKSTIAALLAEETGKPVEDADTQIAALAGKTIPEIFAEDGEDAFRALETQALSELCKRSGLIIATGGGCVTRERNHAILHQNGMVFCLRRDLDKLPTDGRPLSQMGTLREMAAVREPLYASFADVFVDNNGTPASAAGQILSIWEERK